MIRPGYDTCDRGGCGVTSNLYPFPHARGCKYGSGGDDRTCTCGHDADQHGVEPGAGIMCHGCFMESRPSMHPFAPKARAATD